MRSCGSRPTISSTATRRRRQRLFLSFSSLRRSRPSRAGLPILSAQFSLIESCIALHRKQRGVRPVRGAVLGVHGSVARHDHRELRAGAVRSQLACLPKVSCTFSAFFIAEQSARCDRCSGRTSATTAPCAHPASPTSRKRSLGTALCHLRISCSSCGAALLSGSPRWRSLRCCRLAILSSRTTRLLVRRASTDCPR